jgi:hypothetical protein
MLDFLESVFLAREVKDNLVSAQWRPRFLLAFVFARNSCFLLVECRRMPQGRIAKPIACSFLEC